MEEKEQYKMYSLVYADPPYPQKKGGLRNCRPNQNRKLDYPIMSLEEIRKVLFVFQGDILFLWTIDKYLFESQKMAEDLGYKLHARIIWDKENGVAPAFTLRFTKEYLLWFYKSPMRKVDKKMRGKFTDVIREKATIHSKKPQKAYELIESLYPNLEGDRIELFARNKRNGWIAWGNEIDSDVDLLSSKNHSLDLRTHDNPNAEARKAFEEGKKKKLQKLIEKNVEERR